MSDLTPYSLSAGTQVNSLGAVDYTNQDYYSLKTRIRDLIKEKFPNDFNDFIESSLGIMLIEVLIFLTDVQDFKIDQVFNEMYVDSVTEVENLIRYAKSLGFQPTPPICGRASFSATIASVLTEDLVIPAGTSVNIVSNGRQITFEMFPAGVDNNPVITEDIVIPAGSTTNTSIIGIEGQSTSQTGLGTGEVGQTVLLSRSPVIFDSVEVSVNGVLWTKVDYFSDDQPRKEFLVEYDSNYNATVVFGNNRAGQIPTSASQISIGYRIGGGTRGNIISGFIEEQRNIQSTGFDFSIPVTFRNYTRGEFGYNGDGIEDIRSKLPLFIRTQDRAVSGEDYKILAELFKTAFHGQIGKARAALRNSGGAGNIVDLYILARDGQFGLTLASDDLKADLVEELEPKKMITHFLCIKDGQIISVDVNIDLIVDKMFRRNKDEIATKVRNKVIEFFALSRWDYGQTLRDIDLIKYLSDIKEAHKIDLSFATIDPNNSGSIVTTAFNQIIRPDTVEISFIFE